MIALDIGDAARGLDQRDDQRALVRDAHFRADIAAGVIVMRHAERRAAHALRRIAAPRGDLPRLRPGLEHRHHDAHRAGIENRRDQVVVTARHPRHRHDIEAARSRDLHLDRLDPDAAMLGVEQGEIGPGRVERRHQPRGEKLERHRAVHGPAGIEPCAHRVRAHRGTIAHRASSGL